MNPHVDAEQRTTRHEREQDAAFVVFNDRCSATEAAQVQIVFMDFYVLHM